jgi:cytochrome c-type biogenesis protein CcmH/NrfG
MMKKFAAPAILFLALALAVAAEPSPRDLLASGRVDDLTGVLRQRLQSSPADAEAYHLLGRAYFAQRRWDQAVEAAQRAVSLQPNNPEYHLWLGRAYGEKAGHSSFITGANLAKKVKNEFERAVQLNPRSVEARSDLAEFYLEAPGFMGGGKDKALAQAAEIAKLDPARAHWLYAALARKNDDNATAEKELRAAIQASGNDGSYWLNLASFYNRIGRKDDMEAAVNKAVTSEKKKAVVLFDAAELLLNSGRNFPGAIKLLRQYLASDALVEEAPAFRAHYLLGTLLEKTGDRKAAAVEYHAALALTRDFRQAQEGLRRVSP